MYTATLIFNFLGGDPVPVTIAVNIEDNLCRVKTLKLSERSASKEYNVGATLLIPEVIELPVVT